MKYFDDFDIQSQSDEFAKEYEEYLASFEEKYLAHMEEDYGSIL